MWPYPAHYAEQTPSSTRERSNRAAHRYALLQAAREARLRRRQERQTNAYRPRPIARVQALLRG